MKVLIVDDSYPLQTRLLELLTTVNKNINVNQAFSYKEAIERFSSFEPEAVILDIELPDGSGINLLRKFKAERSSVDVIVFTNYSTSEFKKSCMNLCAMDFIDKSDLFSLMKTVSSLKSHHDNLQTIE